MNPCETDTFKMTTVSESPVRASGHPSSVVKLEVLIDGDLSKRSPKQLVGLSLYQRRYFVLVRVIFDNDSTRRQIRYYKSRQEFMRHEAPLGMLEVSLIKHVIPNPRKNVDFDVVYFDRIFYLRADTSATAERWTAAIMQAQQEENRVQEFSHNDVAKSDSANSSMLSDPFETMRALVEATPNQAALFDTGATIELLSRGTAFIKYTWNPAICDADKDVVIVWYNANDGTPLGSIFWSEPGNKIEREDRSIHLHQITDLYVGKQTDTFKSASARQVFASHCFSAATSTTCFDLEGDTKELIAIWLFGINSIMIGKGGKRLRTVQGSDGAKKLPIESLGTSDKSAPSESDAKDIASLSANSSTAEAQATSVSMPDAGSASMLDTQTASEPLTSETEPVKEAVESVPTTEFESPVSPEESDEIVDLPIFNAAKKLPNTSPVHARSPSATPVFRTNYNENLYLDSIVAHGGDRIIDRNADKHQRLQGRRPSMEQIENTKNQIASLALKLSSRLREKAVLVEHAN